MKRFVAVLAASIVAASAMLLLSWTNFFEQVNFIAYDFTMRLAGPVAPVSPTTVVAIDESSLAGGNPWPWPRQRLAELLTVIAKAKPRVIALDILLDDVKEGDNELARAIANAGPIVLPARLDTDKGSDRWLKREEFKQPNIKFGHVHLDPDLDGLTSRSVVSIKDPDNLRIPPLSMQALVAAGVPVDTGVQDLGSGAMIVRPRRINIRFVGEPNSFPQVSAAKVLSGEVSPDQLRDRIVVVGITAEGLEEDRWFTPFAASGLEMPGVEIHANAIDTLYAGREIREVEKDVIFAGLVVMIMLLAWLDGRLEGIRFYAISLLLFPGIVALSWYLMKNYNLWLPFPPFLFAVTFVVPALEIRKVSKLNHDLDSRIEALSQWGEGSKPAEWNAAERLSRDLPAGTQKTAWLNAIQSFNREAAQQQKRRRRFLRARWRNSRWRLGAVDFFQNELVRFLTFNSTILSSIEDVTVVSDVNGRVAYQNPAARSLDGFVENPPFAPDYFASLLDGRDFTASFAEVFGEKKTVTIPFVPTQSRKQVFHVALAPIVSGSSVTGLVLSLHDATAQFELNAAKNEMVSLVSHELRTPLTAIRGYSDMLLKYDLVQDKGKQFLGTILEESDRLNKLIQSFLDIAYIESGRQKVTKTEFEVGPVFRDMVSVLDPVAAAKSIRIQAPVDEVMQVRADRLLLYQALSNLVTNAIKYSPSGTTVRIGVSNGSGRVAFRVADEGFGIPADEAGKIFDKFYRRANKETVEQSGFGLGLAFVKEVAVRHGGEVTVESEVGKGSVFTLRIPA